MIGPSEDAPSVAGIEDCTAVHPSFAGSWPQLAAVACAIVVCIVAAVLVLTFASASVVSDSAASGSYQGCNWPSGLGAVCASGPSWCLGKETVAALEMTSQFVSDVRAQSDLSVFSSISGACVGCCM